MNSANLVSHSESSSRSREWLSHNRAPWLAALILLATCFAFARTPRFNFAYDDFVIIVLNARVHSVHFLKSYFTQEVWAGARAGAGNLYRPFFMTWLLANYGMFGLSPAGWHVTTVLIHLLATLLVYLVASKLLPGNPIPALVAMAIFGLHPIHVEAVAWVSGVTEPFASCFFLGSFLCFIKFQEQTSSRFAWLTGSLLLFAGALCSKETTIVLPAVIAWYSFCFIRRKNNASTQTWIKSTISLLVPYAIVVLVYLAVRNSVLHGFAHRMSAIPLGTSLPAVPWAIYFYVSQLLIPAGLGLFYDVDFGNMLSIAGLLLPCLVLAALVSGVIWWTRKSKSYLVLFLSGWFVLTLMPSLGVFLMMSRYEGVHDRYLYLPSVAFAILVGYSWGKIFPSARLTLQATLGAVLLAGLIFSTRRQTEYWKSDLTLFTRACAVAPNNALAKLNLSAELVRRNDFSEGLKLAQEVIQQDPTMGTSFSLAGKCAFFLGDYADAESCYRRSLALEAPEAGDLYILALSEIKLGQYAEGLQVLRDGLSAWPASPLYHYAMGLAYAGRRDWPDAAEQYRIEIAEHPESSLAGPALADAEAHLKAPDGARK
jgi:hypothetical protein